MFTCGFKVELRLDPKHARNGVDLSSPVFQCTTIISLVPEISAVSANELKNNFDAF